VVLLTGSGSGSLEAAIVNTLSPGDRVLSVNIGAFGDRFAKIATVFGAEVERFDEMAAELARREDVAPEAASELAAAVLTCATGLALQRVGWAIVAAPGEPVHYHRGEDKLAPHAVVADLREGRVSAKAWRAEAERLGIAALALLPLDAPVARSEAASSEAANV
jgi:hypothetical protein